MSVLSQFIDEYRPAIEDGLRAVLSPPAGAPILLYKMLHYHMGWIDADDKPTQSEGGKRIRPMLCLLVCYAAGGDPASARSPAAALELIHNFSLLHDDIQDRSPLRHNRPTVWGIWGEKQAINTGDALFALAHLAIPRLARPGADGKMLTRMLEILDEASLDLTHGQHLDIAFESRDDVTTQEYLDMIRAKTAALLAAAAHLGALAGGADDQTQAHYRAFGENLGLAFQVLDDTLDIWGDPTLTGKETAVDIRQRKKSLPVLYALQHCAKLRTIYADPRPFDDERVARVVALLEAADTRQYAEELARKYSHQTLSHLEAAEPHENAGEALFELVDQLLHRDR